MCFTIFLCEKATLLFIIIWADGIINILNKLKKPPTLRDKLTKQAEVV